MRKRRYQKGALSGTMDYIKLLPQAQDIPSIMETYIFIFFQNPYELTPSVQFARQGGQIWMRCYYAEKAGYGLGDALHMIKRLRDCWRAKKAMEDYKNILLGVLIISKRKQVKWVSNKSLKRILKSRSAPGLGRMLPNLHILFDTVFRAISAANRRP